MSSAAMRTLFDKLTWVHFSPGARQDHSSELMTCCQARNIFKKLFTQYRKQIFSVNSLGAVNY